MRGAVKKKMTLDRRAGRCAARLFQVDLMALKITGEWTGSGALHPETRRACIRSLLRIAWHQGYKAACVGRVRKVG